MRVDVVDLPRRDQPAADDKSVIRSWIAMTLVFGLLIFCATAFVVGDSALRSTLFGGLVASVGAAVACYFSSKTAGTYPVSVIAWNAAGAIVTPPFNIVIN